MILLAAALAAAPLATARWSFAGFTLLYGVSAAIWVFVRGAGAPLRTCLLIAIALRLTVVAAPPLLSGDAYRYLWDGKVLRSGVSPYRYAPADPTLSGLRESWHSSINHPEIPTIYPPLAQWLFAATPSLLMWRLLMIAADLGIIVLLRKDSAAAFAWAIFPPAVIEGAWSAHLDLLVGLALLLAMLRSSPAWAGAAAGLKLIPIAAWPALAAQSKRPVRFLALAAAATAIPATPFLFSGSFMPGLRDYSTRWIFNAPLFFLARSMLERADVAERLKRSWTLVKGAFPHEWAQPVYAYLYADFIARAAMATFAILSITVLVAKRRSVSSCVAALLLCAPALHPWYWLIVGPIAMLERSRLAVAMALCAPFSYLLYQGAPAGVVAILCYVLPLAIAWTRPSGSGTSADAERSGETLPRTTPGTSRA
ncbi:MAG TPA: hypothetical protein VFL80_13060 [Thermoanaerobaculia bacterium]|nr:hypothetical protein [Thermoanaerobaculia bacterium]